jgi:hypothetical protein
LHTKRGQRAIGHSIHQTYTSDSTNQQQASKYPTKMQIQSLLLLGLFGTAFASPIEGISNAVGSAQDLPTIQSAVDAVSAALTSLDGAVSALAPGGDVKAAAAGVIAKSKAVETALKDGAAKVSATSPISLTEALQIQQTSSKLTTLVTQVINNLISKKDIITQAGEKKTTLDILTSQKAASDAFIQAITSKVPSAVQSVAATVTKSVGDAIAKGVSAFS